MINGSVCKTGVRGFESLLGINFLNARGGVNSDIFGSHSRESYPFDKPLSLKWYKKIWKNSIGKKGFSVTAQTMKKLHQRKQRQHNNLLCKGFERKIV